MAPEPADDPDDAPDSADAPDTGHPPDRPRTPDSGRAPEDSGRTPEGPVDPLEQALHAARARVLADLTTDGVAEPDVVSVVEESVSHRRWWVGQWPEGAVYVAGLVAQDVQDALLERYGRWPLCPVCPGGDPHPLGVEPELGADPHWVCEEAGVRVAAVGSLGRPHGRT